MATTAQGNCLCGASGYRFGGEVKFAIRCHCRDCQFISGGGHLPQVAVLAASFDERGPLKSFLTQSDSGNEVTLTFCGDCKHAAVQNHR